MKNIRNSGLTLLELTVVLLVLTALAGLVLPFTQGTVEQAACQATDATMRAVKEAIMGSGASPGYYSDMGNYPASPGNPTAYNLHYLFVRGTHPQFKPTIAKGWRGPYLQNGGGKLQHAAELANAGFDDDGSNPSIPPKVHFQHCTPVNGNCTSPHLNDFYVLDHYPWRRPLVLQVPHSGTCPGYPNANWCARLVSAGPNGQIDTPITDTSASNRGDDRVLFLRIPDPNPNGNLPCVQTS